MQIEGQASITNGNSDPVNIQFEKDVAMALKNPQFEAYRQPLETFSSSMADGQVETEGGIDRVLQIETGDTYTNTISVTYDPKKTTKDEVIDVLAGESGAEEKGGGGGGESGSGGGGGMPILFIVFLAVLFVSVVAVTVYVLRSKDDGDYFVSKPSFKGRSTSRS